MINILAIGTISDVKNNKFTGQSIMFDGLVDELKARGICVKTINISSRFKANSLVLRCLDYSLALIKALWCLMNYRINIGYITTAQSKKGFIRDYAIISLFKLFKVKVIAHQYGANYHQLIDALDKREMNRLKKMLNYVSFVIVEGEYMKNQYSFLEDYEKKVKVIPNGLPNVGKSAMRSKFYLKKEPFIMYYLSNLIWSKGYFDVLQAVDLLINKYKKTVQCVFAGAFMASVDDEKPGISNKEDFDKYVKEHCLEDVVSYFPGMYGEQKDETFLKSNVFLLPSYYINEGQPVSIIEAMAYGCVPIVTEYRHIPMMVNTSNGCFVNPKDPQQIAETIVYLMDHQEEYALKSQACIRDYKEKFTFDKYASQVINIISEIVNKQ